MIFLKKLRFTDRGDEHDRHICLVWCSFVDGFVSLHDKHVHVLADVVANVVVSVVLLSVMTVEPGVADRWVAPAITPLPS